MPPVDPRNNAEAQVVRESTWMRLLRIPLIARHGAEVTGIDRESVVTKSRVSNARTEEKSRRRIKFNASQFRSHAPI
jgi:hypothetical protein